METIETKLAKLASLPSNWDSYGARPVTPAALAKAHDLLLSQVQITPTVNGGVQLEWTNDGFEIEIDIGPLGNILHVYAEAVSP